MGSLSGADWAIISTAGPILIIGIAVFLYLRRVRNSAYEGKVLSKGSRVDDDDGTTSYFIVVQLANGKTKRVYLKQKQWQQWAVGEALIKRPGALQPERA